MKAITKILTGAATAALITVSAASPAQAQYRDRYYDRDRGGIDAGDILTGVAILGGIAAITSAFSRDSGRYGYNDRYRDYGSRYRNDYSAAVNSCGYEAQRAGRGQVRITDVDRRGGNAYRVRGVIEGGYNGYDQYQRYDRYDRYDRYNSYDNDRQRFTCIAYGNGRISDFRFRG